jgi:hypothetical protein
MMTPSLGSAKAPVAAVRIIQGKAVQMRGEAVQAHVSAGEHNARPLKCFILTYDGQGKDENRAREVAHQKGEAIVSWKKQTTKVGQTAIVCPTTSSI